MTSFDLNLWRRSSTATSEEVAVGRADAPFDSGVADLAPPAPVHARARCRPVDIGLRAVGPIVLFLAWWYASRVGWLNPQVLAGPGAVWSTFATMVDNGTLWSNLSASLSLAFTGLAIGAGIGIALGILTGFTRLGDELLDPVLQMMRTIPFLAVLPLFIVWFGIGREPKIILIALASAFPLYLNTHGGVRDVDRKIIEASRAYGVSQVRSVWEIVIPGALPSLLVGLRIALGVSLLALIFAEQINTTKGIGYLLFTAQAYFQTNIMVVCVVIYAAWGLLADLAVRSLERLLMPWQHAARSTRRAAAR